MAAVYQGERTILSPLLAPIEKLLYRLAGVDPTQEMDWKRYAVAVLLFHPVGFAPVRGAAPAGGAAAQPAVPAGRRRPLAFNTAVSFATNTNWQSYGGETTLSYLTQMLGLTVQNFVSAAAGIAVGVAPFGASPDARRPYRRLLGRPDARML